MIYIAADAKSQNTRAWTRHYLEVHGYSYTDLGAQSSEDVIDITDFIPKVAEKLSESGATAIVSCGNGIGVSIGMNRYKGIRAALAVRPDFAEWGKLYDDCNVLCLADWSMHSENDIAAVLDTWFATTFDPIPRRTARIKKLDSLGP